MHFIMLVRSEDKANSLLKPSEIGPSPFLHNQANLDLIDSTHLNLSNLPKKRKELRGGIHR